FVHDRVREALYRRVRDDEAAQLHSRIARSLERRGDSEAQSNRGVLVYDLAYHYGKANDADKALLYCRKAGQMAAQASAHGLAVTLYEQARAILEKQNRAQTEEYGVVLEELGEVYRISGRFDQAIEALRKCLSLVPEKDIVHQALVLAKMGDACFENGEPGKAANLIERGLRRLGASLPEKKWGVRLAIAWEFLKQLTHIARPEWMTRRFREASLSDLTRIRLRSRLFYIYYFNDMDRAFYVYLSNLNLCENRAPSKVLASQYVLGGPVWVSFPWVWKALRDLNRGLRLAKQFSDTLQEARLLTHFAFVMRVDNRPKEGLEYCRQAIHALRGLGEYFDLGVAFVFRNHCNWMGNTPFTEALRQNAEFMSVARDTHLLQPLGWSMINQGIYAAFHGEWPEDAVPIVRKGVEMLVKIKDLPDIVYGHAFEAMLHLRYGRLDDALASARQVEKLLPTHEMKASWIQELFPICAEVYLEAIATRPDAEPSAMAEYWRGAERFCRESRWRARRFNYIQGWSCQVNGTLWWLKGRRNRAERWWNEGIEFLGRKPSTYRLANLLLESGRRRLGVDPTDLKARERILEARDLFEKLDAPKDLKTASALLERTAERGGEVDSRNALTFKRHLDSLLSVTQVIGSVFDARELLEKIVDYAMKVTGAQRGFILLTGAANEPLELRVQRGVDASTLNSPFSYGTYGVSLGLVEAVRQKREASISSAQDAGEIAAELKSCGVRQAMAVLLSTKAKDLGVLYLDNHLADGMFG
ncbi:MAG: hypothetical protein JO317_08705, partial [Verrucomicrobiae bacterium]|nr:hypothetical protein [Verrucomicrobiae bacterium]